MQTSPRTIARTHTTSITTREQPDGTRNHLCGTATAPQIRTEVVDSAYLHGTYIDEAAVGVSNSNNSRARMSCILSPPLNDIVEVLWVGQQTEVLGRAARVSWSKPRTP